MNCSIVLATYNAEQYLPDLLRSIDAQETPADEIIISDDASEDSTAELLNDFVSAEESSGTRHLFLQDRNLGYKKNFRKALGLSTKELIFLSDQDDIWHPDKIRKMKKVMEDRPEIELLASDYEPFGDMENKAFFKVKGRGLRDGSITKASFSDVHLDVMRPGCTYCVRRSLLSEMMENDIQDESHDAVLWRLATVRGSLYLINDALIDYRRHGGNATVLSFDNTLRMKCDTVKELQHSCVCLLKYAGDKGYEDASKELLSYGKFLDRRLELLENKRFWKMVAFAASNKDNYTTGRNRISDVLSLIGR